MLGSANTFQCQIRVGLDVTYVVTVDATTTPESLLPWRPINTNVDCVITLVDVDTCWRMQLLR